MIVERALEALLAQALKKKAALTERPRAPKQRAPAASGATRRRDIPAAIKREVWQREQGRCGFVGADGSSCGETRGLEFAHEHPWGKGGEHSAENLSLRCKAHNALEADRDYGEAFMRSKRNGSMQVNEPRAVWAAQLVSHGPTGNRLVGRAGLLRQQRSASASTEPSTRVSTAA